MYTILDSNNVSVYMYNDENAGAVEITAEDVKFHGDITDTLLNSSNCKLVNVGDTAPEDWIGRRYVYDNGVWSPNPNDPMKQ